jgi:hypothetical protein
MVRTDGWLPTRPSRRTSCGNSRRLRRSASRRRRPPHRHPADRGSRRRGGCCRRSRRRSRRTLRASRQPVPRQIAVGSTAAQRAPCLPVRNAMSASRLGRAPRRRSRGRAVGLELGASSRCRTRPALQPKRLTCMPLRLIVGHCPRRHSAPTNQAFVGRWVSVPQASPAMSLSPTA